MAPSLQLEAAWKDDLPDKFGAMNTKELRQSLRRGSFVYPFLAIQFFAVGAMAMEFRGGQSQTLDPDWVGLLNIALLWKSGPFWMVVGLVCTVILPMGGILRMVEELEDGNHELLLLTRLDRWRVVLGKFAGLWGMSVLTFVSLMPYMLVRYLVGGIEWWYELACAGTVLGVAALVCAGVIGASGFGGMGMKTMVLLLYLGSATGGGGVAILSTLFGPGGAGWLYHLNAVVVLVAYTVVGLALARSKMRLALHAYEVRPSRMLVALLVFSPCFIGMVTAFTLGKLGLIAVLIMGWVAWYCDQTPKAPRWVPAPPPNVPPSGGSGGDPGAGAS